MAIVHDEVVKYKRQLLSEIVNNENIVEAISSTSASFIEGQGDSLIGTNVFPMLYVPDIQDEAAIFIGVEAEIISESRRNDAFHNWKVTIWVMAHRDVAYWREKGCSRIDFISDELKRMFQYSNNYGYGELNLSSNRTHLLNPKYSYRQLILSTSDLKRAFV